jgi:succinyl-CoA synthetase beta subunit
LDNSDGCPTIYIPERELMKIHEYQGKEILRQFGVPVPRGIAAFTVQEAVEAAQKLGGPVWVVKAQIHAGGRGKGGGVKVAKTIDDVKRLASEILGMQLKTHQTGPEGQKVRRLYIEDGADIQKEYYVSVVTDPEGRLHRIFRGRHGHRGSGPLLARENHHRIHRPAHRTR